MEGVEPLAPELPVVGQPVIDVDQCLGAQAIDAPLRIFAYVDQAGLSQHPKVARDARTSDRKRVGKLAGRRIVIAQDAEHRPPTRVGQRVQNGVHMVNVPTSLRNKQGTYLAAVAYGILAAMSSTLTARVIGAFFGLAFVLINASAAPTPWSWVLRVLGIAAFVGAVLRLRRLGEITVRPRPSAIRIYWASVILEAAALVLGTRLLADGGHGAYGVAWVAFVVGVHFLPFAWAFRQPAFRPLGLALIVLAVVGAVTGLLGAGKMGVALVAGVGAGLALLTFAAAPPRAQPSEG